MLSLHQKPRAQPSNVSAVIFFSKTSTNKQTVRAAARSKNTELLLRSRSITAASNNQMDISGLQILLLRLILRASAGGTVTFDKIGHLFIVQTGLKRGFSAIGYGSIKHFCIRRLKLILEEHKLVVHATGVGSKAEISVLVRKPHQKKSLFGRALTCLDHSSRSIDRPRPVFSLQWDIEDGLSFDNDEKTVKKTLVDDEAKQKLLTAVLTPYFPLRKILDTLETSVDLWAVKQGRSLAGTHFPWPNWNLLFLAVWTGNIGACEAIFEFLVRRNSNNEFLNSTNQHGQSLLHIACLRSEETVVEWLLSMQANPNIVNLQRGSQTPLHLAALKGSVGCVRALLKSGADPQKLADNGRGPCSAIGLAICGRYSFVVQALLGCLATVSQTENGHSTLQRALWSYDENLSMMVFLAAQVVDLDVVSAVVCTKSFRLLHFLFQNSKNQFFWLDAFTRAVQCNFLDVVQVLLMYISTPEPDLSSQLSVAILGGFTGIAACLLEHQVSLPSNINASISGCFIANKMTSTLAQLLESAGCHLDEVINVLHYAIASSDDELVAYVCERYPYLIDRVNAVGYSPLHEVVRAKNGELLTLLIRAGADVNLRNPLREGLTALHLAAGCGWAGGIKELVRAGADLNCKKSSWKPPRTAVGIAMKSGFDQAANALMELGAHSEGLIGRKVTVEFGDQEPETLSKWMNVSQDERTARSRQQQTEAVKMASNDTTVHQGPWKVIRVFISSTFRDMHAERDFLVSHVLSALRRKCQERRLHVVDIDLRWGVTEAEAQSGESVELCLREVSNCNIFISLLGDRYGWVPGPSEARVRYPVAASNDLSITAMEVEHALSRGPEVDCFFFIRDSNLEADIPSSHQQDFFETDETPRQWLLDLKQRIRASKCSVTEYTASFESIDADGKVRLRGLESMGEALSSQLWDAIVRRYPLSTVSVDAFVVEANYHKDFVQSKSESFVGRSEVVSRLLQYACTNGGKPLVVTGGPGSGKSALMGFFARYAYHETRNTVVIVHSVGASPLSTNIYDTMWHLCSSIIHEFAFWDKVPSEFHERVLLFKQLIQRIPQTKRKLLIVFDALNQLNLSNHSHNLHWLPSDLPPEVGVLLSCLEGNCLRVLRRRGTPELKLEGFSNQERAEMVTRLLGSYQKKLDAGQMSCLLSKEDAMHPLYLIVACEELRVYGVYEKLLAKIESLLPTTQGLLSQTLQRLEMQHGDACKELLCVLFLSRHGLLETELFELVQRPVSKFSALLMSLQMFLRVVGKPDEGYFDFFHRQFAKAVETRYLQLTSQQQLQNKDTNTKNSYHLRLANFYQLCADPQGDKSWKQSTSSGNHSNAKRAFQSLPYHLLHASESSALVTLLTDLQFVQTKCEQGLIHDLISDYASAEEEALKDTTYEGVLPFKRFLLDNVHILERHPNLVYQQARVSKEAEVKTAADEMTIKDAIVCINYKEPKRHFFVSMVGPERVNVVHYSPDAKFLLVGYFDGNLILWSAATFARVACVMSSRGRITDACFSPDGQVVAATSGLAIDIYQTASLNLLHTLLGQDGSHTDEVLCCAFRPSGYHLVSGGADRRLVVWDWAKERVVASAAVCKREEVAVSTAAALSSSVSLQGVLREVVQGSVVSVAVSQDDKTIVCGSANKCVFLFLLANSDDKADNFGVKQNKEQDLSLFLKYTMQGHTKCVNHVAISPQNLIASVGQDRNLIIWTEHGQVLSCLKSHSENVACVNFSEDGNLIVTASWDKTIKVFEKSSLSDAVWNEIRTLKGHAHYVNYASFAPSGEVQYIVSGSVDMTTAIYMFDRTLTNAKEDVSAVDGHKDLIRSLQYCSSLDCVLTSSWDHHVKLFNRTGQQVWDLVASSKRVNSIAVAPNGALFATGASDNTAAVWEMETRQQVLVFEGHTDAVFAVEFSHDMQYLASGSCDKTIIIWSLEAAAKIVQFEGHEDWVMCLHFSMFSRRLVSGCQSGQIKVWDVVRQSNLTTILAHTGAVLACMFTPCERKIVSASVDKTIKVFDACFYTPLLSISTHTNEVTCLAFITSPSLPLSLEERAIAESREEDNYNSSSSNDGSRENGVKTLYVVSGSSDKSVVVSDLETGAYIRSYHGDGAVMSVAALDSSHFAVGDSLGVFSLLELRTGDPRCEAQFQGESKDDGIRWLCGQILSMEPIVGTRLQMCQISVGGEKPLQVITSATNVRLAKREQECSWDMTLWGMTKKTLLMRLLLREL